MTKVERVLPETNRSAVLGRRFANELHDELSSGRMSFKEGYDLVANLAAHLAMWSNTPRGVAESLGYSIKDGVEFHLATVGGGPKVAGSA